MLRLEFCLLYFVAWVTGDLGSLVTQDAPLGGPQAPHLTLKVLYHCGPKSRGVLVLVEVS